MKLCSQSIVIQLRLVQMNAINYQPKHFWKSVFLSQLLEIFDDWDVFAG
jgi:hypothetical protein